MSPQSSQPQSSQPKQEQQSASEEVVEVAPGVLRMQLPIQMPGLGHVNMYCLLDRQGAAVIDPGLPGEESWSAVVDRLAKADLRVRDVHTVVVTHSHPDHFGGAARFKAETDCKVIAHARFDVMGRSAHEPHLEVSVEHLPEEELESAPGPQPVAEADAELEPPWLRDPDQRPPTPWGGRPPAPTAAQRERWERLRASGEHNLFVPRLTHVVEHGSKLRLCDRDFRVWHTPGHTADHVCLHDRDEGIFLAGDHVLPSITPHISGLGHIADPLDAFYQSLQRVAAIEGVGRCLPAHGHPFDDLAQRADAIRLHHDARLEKLIGIARSLGPATVQQLSEQLFQPRNWGSMAESETYAHMEYLRLRRRAEVSRRDDGQLQYTV